jgi:hypothetical protein
MLPPLLCDELRSMCAFAQVVLNGVLNYQFRREGLAGCFTGGGRCLAVPHAIRNAKG